MSRFRSYLVLALAVLASLTVLAVITHTSSSAITLTSEGGGYVEVWARVGSLGNLVIKEKFVVGSDGYYRAVPVRLFFENATCYIPIAEVVLTNYPTPSVVVRYLANETLASRPIPRVGSSGLQVVILRVREGVIDVWVNGVWVRNLTLWRPVTVLDNVSVGLSLETLRSAFASRARLDVVELDVTLQSREPLSVEDLEWGERFYGKASVSLKGLTKGSGGGGVDMLRYALIGLGVTGGVLAITLIIRRRSFGGLLGRLRR